MVNPLVMDDPDVLDIEKSFADWCFFGERCNAGDVSLWNISCITDTVAGEKFTAFALDTYHTGTTALNISSHIYGLGPDPETDCENIMKAVCGIDPDTPC